MISKKILFRILSVLYLSFIGASSAVFFVCACCLWLITKPFDRRKILLNLFSSLWASLYTWCMPVWRVKILGRHRLSLSQNYVLVSNHQSQLDILVLYRLFFPFRWVSKVEVFRLPFIGWNMLLNGYVKLKRGDGQSIKKMMDTCEQLLRQGNSVFFFPEGTRSRDGRLKLFKPGAFILAKKAKVPILPVVINHTKDALPKHSLQLNGRHTMTVKILEEIPVSAFEDLEPDRIAEKVRGKIAPHIEV